VESLRQIFRQSIIYGWGGNCQNVTGYYLISVDVGPRPCAFMLRCSQQSFTVRYMANAQHNSTVYLPWQHTSFRLTLTWPMKFSSGLNSRHQLLVDSPIAYSLTAISRCLPK